MKELSRRDFIKYTSADMPAGQAGYGKEEYSDIVKYLENLTEKWNQSS